MPFGPLEESVLTVAAPSHAPAPFTPYKSNLSIQKSRYITSNDPRGYIPVYEYSVNGHWIMIDADDSFVLWTGIWKALGNSKADIVKMVESVPDLASQIRRVRGGYLKIQGTWMPYKTAAQLARRVAYNIREELVPIFGPDFPGTCLAPHEAGYGQLGEKSSRRRPRRSAQASVFSASGGQGGHNGGWAMVNWNTASTSSESTIVGQQPSHRASSSQSAPVPTISPATELSVMRSPTSYAARYAPYSGPRSPPPPEHHPRRRASADASVIANREMVTLAPMYSSQNQSTRENRKPPLPPVNELSTGRPLSATESRALLHRLRTDDANHSMLPSPKPPVTAALSHEAALLDQDMRRRSEILLAGGCATEVHSPTAISRA
ncbi:DNA-binding domain of Mlu1-box binding protein MBP1 [Peniophora sp. CONT]|nr:DNA-binding domain of Mlu1-box binding protein MBP1 [Peniophora sp. CONT]